MKVTNIAKHLGKILGFALLIAIFVMVFGVYWQITHGENADYQEVKEAIIQYGSDLNEMRDYLYLPQNEYAFFQSESEVDLSNMETPEDNKYQQGISLFAEELAKTQALKNNQETAKAKLTEWVRDQDFNQILVDINLRPDGEISVDESHARVKILRGDQAVVQILLDIESGELSAQSIRGIETISVPQGQVTTRAIFDYLEANADKILALKEEVEAQKAAMTGLLQSEDVQQVANANTLNLNVDPVATHEGLEYYATDLDGSPLLTVTLNPKTATFEMETAMYSRTDELKPSLLEKLGNLDGETDQIKMIREREEGLASYLKSDAFLEAGLKVGEAQASDTQVAYDLIQAETEAVLGQIVFDRLSGEIRFREAGSEMDYSLEEILSGSKKKP